MFLDHVAEVKLDGMAARLEAARSLHIARHTYEVRDVFPVRHLWVLDHLSAPNELQRDAVMVQQPALLDLDIHLSLDVITRPVHGAQLLGHIGRYNHHLPCVLAR